MTVVRWAENSEGTVQFREATLMILYKIWHVSLDADPKKQQYHTYPLEHILSVIIHYRDQVISSNYDKLKPICDYYNRIKDSNEYFEIRGEEVNVP